MYTVKCEINLEIKNYNFFTHIKSHLTAPLECDGIEIKLFKRCDSNFDTLQCHQSNSCVEVEGAENLHLAAFHILKGAKGARK